MSVRKSVGNITAYAAAVKGGYTGTYEEFCAEQANFAKNAQKVAEDREAVEKIKTDTQDIKEAAVKEVGDAKNAALTSIGNTARERLTAIQTAGSAQVEAVQDAGALEVEDVEKAGAAERDALDEAAEAKTAEAEARIEAKGAAVLATIPEEYTETYQRALRNESRISRNEKRLTNLEQGITPDPYYVDDTVAYSKDVPANALPFAEVNKVGGMTYRINTGTEEAPVYELRSAPVTEVESVGTNMFGGDPLADKLVEVASATKNTNAGTVEFSAKNVSGKRLYESFKPNTRYTVILYGRNSATKISNIIVVYSDGSSVKLNFTETNANSYCVVTTADGKSVKYIGGSWNDGDTTLYYDKCGVFEGVLTYEDFKPYTRNTLPIPEAVQALDGYGWGVSDTVYNYIDLERKQFVKRVDEFIVDGSVTPTIYGENDINVEGTIIEYEYAKLGISPATRSKKLCDKLSCDNIYPASWKDCAVGEFGYNTIGSADDYLIFNVGKFATVKEVTDWLNSNPIHFKYELAEPIITDISDLLSEDNYIPVEAGGAVTMLNEYAYAVPSEITYALKEAE